MDDHTLVLRTDAPYPLLLADLTNVGIVSRKHGAGATTDDYNTGKAMVGTGPYRFVEWVSGDRLVLQRNPSYWGEKATWDRVTFKPITSAATRTAALLSGDVDAINNVSSTDVERLKKEGRVSVWTIGGNRLLYLGLDVDRDASPFVTDAAGQPMAKNPLKDVRVRRALSKAINRDALVARVMEGQAMAASQFLPDGFSASAPTSNLNRSIRREQKSFWPRRAMPMGSA